MEQEEKDLAIKALYAYLSAGNKLKRTEASKIAKEAYKKLTGIDYQNPE